MPITKTGTSQIKNDAGLPRILRIYINNGTTTRSSTASATVQTLACIGDTTYTAPADTNVDIFFQMTQMAMNTSGVTRCFLSINGTLQNPGTYQNITPWVQMSCSYRISVEAGQTITIGCMWAQEGGGTGTLTNASGDASFPNEIYGIVTARQS